MLGFFIVKGIPLPARLMSFWGEKDDGDNCSRRKEGVSQIELAFYLLAIRGRHIWLQKYLHFLT